MNNIKLSLDWVPQAEHGGYFQAIAKGYYADQDIELTIIPGGPICKYQSPCLCLIK